MVKNFAGIKPKRAEKIERFRLSGQDGNLSADDGKPKI